MTKDESIKNADTESLTIMIEIFKEIGISEELEAETIITDQLPKAGIQITKGTEVILYSN